MHIFFSGIGGTGLGPLAAGSRRQAGPTASQVPTSSDSQYIHYLRSRGITNISIGQTVEQIRAVHDRRAIDLVQRILQPSPSKLLMPQELRFCQLVHIKATKRDVLLAPSYRASTCV